MAGGVRAVAARAGVDASNLSKFVRRGAGLSPEKEIVLENALGRPGGRLDPDRVLVLRVRRVDADLAWALAWYAPEGAEVARAAWSGLTWARLRKFIRADLAPEIYAVRARSGGRMLLMLPAGPMLPRRLFPDVCPGLVWYGGEPERAVLEMDEPSAWLAGEVDAREFDAAWPERAYNPQAEDLLAAVRRLRISWAEAIRRVNYNE